MKTVFPEPPAPPHLPIPQGPFGAVPGTAYCPACTHPFLVIDAHGHDLTHYIDIAGNSVCKKCTAARPCRATLAPGAGGVRFATHLEPDKPTYRGLNRDGPVH